MPMLTLALLLGPVLAGLVGTLAPAFGILPVIGRVEPGVDAFRALLAWPGLPGAVWLSMVTGLGATVISLVIVMLLVACWSGTRSFAAFRRALSPLLSVPHAAAAFGLAFLVAPSGLVVRLLSPWATGWTQPPDLLIVQDPAGLSLMAGLVVKEVPFLLLMTLAALGQADAVRAETVARSLGHDRPAAWLKAVFPRVYAQIRLPVLVVLAFSMTVVDVALILGPNTPPTLAVQVVRWMNAPDLAMRLQAAAAATLQLALVVAALGLWCLGERVVAWLGRAWIWSGARRAGGAITAALSLALAGSAALTVLAGLGVLAIWSFAGFWRFPSPWPDAMTLGNWVRHWPGVAEALGTTIGISALSTFLALVLAIGCLEAEHRHALRLRARGQWLLYLPLLAPQVAFLPGVQTWMLMLGVKGGVGAVVAAHVIFVFPYVFLSLGDPFRAWDARQATIAHSLGAGPDRVLWAVRLPMLLAPLLTAAAVGFAVSVGQYLPTLLIGGGRVQTVTTEAVALAAGGDRRAIAVWAIVQTGLALLPFALAVGLPRLVWCNRRGLLHG
ncbi:ABC transporter permease [Lutimaribacter sp. EGI FJ00015]|uniref:ABC transporter permease n=1 Tax=Lutimaribacter degradans TaxID=2945989 RepID=A0ACC6A053_9RHOB|nr:ABC transporter permease [Lutimaribacter sp. EGI FJ00013]MCM2562994.1 ABC transporter permease [Lutimaribacter sp. EGI FJ00013]MCO0614162.1 ABC transporter permease [Lutimaribacter sp. EGI FJ00015]